MKIKLPIIFFLFFSSLNASGQKNVDGNWRLSQGAELVFKFENSKKLTIENKDKKSNSLYPKVYKIKVAESLVVLEDKGVIFDTLSIIKISTDSLTLLHHSTSETLVFLKESFVEKNLEKVLLKKIHNDSIKEEYDLLIKNSNLNIDLGKGIQKLYKRGESILLLNKNRQCLEKLSYETYYDDFKNQFILRIFDGLIAHSDKEKEYKLILKRFVNDTIFGVTVKETPYQLYKYNKDSNSTDSLIGTYVVFRNKEKLEKSINKETATIYVGHLGMEIFKGNRFSLRMLEDSITGNIHFENFEGVNYFRCYADGEKSKWDDDSLILQGQIIKINDDYFTLSPVECMFIPTSDSINNADNYKDGVLLDHGKTPVDLNFYFRKI